LRRRWENQEKPTFLPNLSFCHPSAGQARRAKAATAKAGQSQSKWVKVGQTSSVGQAGGRSPCKSLKMNNLQNKQHLFGQTMLNLVKHGQKKPIHFGEGEAVAAKAGQGVPGRPKNRDASYWETDRIFFRNLSRSFPK
jgi:hypothetical protein